MADFAVFIGRFQPVHAGHIGVLKRALKRHERVIIAIGSSNRATTHKNPFTFEERKCLWEDEMAYDGSINYHRVSFISLDDMLYSDVEWVSQVRHRVKRKVADLGYTDPSIAIVGHEKDHTSYYLKFFPEWESDLLNSGYDTMAATNYREYFYRKYQEEPDRIFTPDQTYGSELRGLPMRGSIWSDTFQEKLRAMSYEWSFDNGYDPKRYHVNVLTVDACVVMNGHVLVVRRKNRPGLGLFAMPGGHINLHETLEDAMLRELREETGIDRSNRVLKSNIVKTETFDHPDRSSRARVITTAYLIKLPDENKLPKVQGADDASEAFWMPLSEVSGEDFFEDHSFIIQKLTAGL